MKFSLTQESQIVLYGASLMAAKWAKHMLEEKYKIIAFIDRYAEKIEKVDNIPVYTLSQWIEFENREAIIIIMLQNAIQHDDIANNLYQNGFNRIIFCPMNSFKKKDNAVIKMKRIYNNCIRFNFNNKIDSIPEYKDIILQIPNLDGIIYKNAKEVVVRVPVELCFADDAIQGENWRSSDYTEEAEALLNEYVRGRNLYSLRPYWELFLYLRGETENCKLYLSIFGKKGHTSHENYNDEKLLTDKREIYYLYLKELIGGSRSFFQDSPAEGGVTSNNRVVIYDGLHRSIFLLMLGCHWVPVRLYKRELQLMGNRKYLNKIKKYIIDHDVQQIENPIEYHDFYNFPINRCDLTDLWGKLSRMLVKEKFQLKSVFDLSLTNSYFIRNFIRLGIADAKCYIEENDEFTTLVNSLFYMDTIKLISDINSIQDIMNQSDFIIINGKLILDKRVSFDQITDLTEKKICIFDLPLNLGYTILNRDNHNIKLLSTYTLEGITMGMYFIC